MNTEHQQTNFEEDKANAKVQLEKLVSRYRRERADYVRSGSGYVEAQLRNDFLNPFLKLLGWDVDNEIGSPQHLREVVQEDVVEVEEDNVLREKNPDYTLRVGSERKAFLEAKKPSVRIETNSNPAFQVRRYGWSANLQVSILSNFEHLAIYDCRHQPKQEDTPVVARRYLYHFEECIEKFDKIYDLLSRDAMFGGSVELEFASEDYRGVQPFDSYFLEQIERWREQLATSLHVENTALTEEQLNYLVQRLINRIIFLRVCEGRNLETHERLKGIASYEELKEIFVEADRRYNSGLFDFAEDELSLAVTVKSDVLVSIFKELYLPESPYAFSVVEPDVIGEIYETYLGKQVALDADGKLWITEKPEVAASSGVVPTPSYMAQEIVEKTLQPLVAGKAPQELDAFSVADLSCGSGVFLLAAFNYLLNYHREWYLAQGPENYQEQVFQGRGQRWFLTLEEKVRILRDTVFGVDIDLQAIEVTRFSLLTKLIEDETSDSVTAYTKRTGSGALPSLKDNVRLGNSLVDERYFAFNPDAELDENLLAKLRPFSFAEEFPDIFDVGGFSAIVGNPPYIRIQNLAKYSREELAYYRSPLKPFVTATSSNIDKYYLFVERSLTLLREGGRLGFIVPHKFFLISAGANLRNLIASQRYLSEIVHFGVHQVFPGRTTYTAIVILDKGAAESFKVERVLDFEGWRSGQRERPAIYRAEEIGKPPWVFVSSQAREVFERVERARVQPLSQFAKVFVGLQTSADDIYIKRHQDMETVYESDSGTFLADYIVFHTDRGEWGVESAILVPCLQDATVRLFRYVKPNAFMIFPYHPETRIPYTEAQMASQFPKAWAYLNAHKDRLESRSISGGTTDEWYRFGRSQSLLEFGGGEKLIWPTLSLRPSYGFDRLNTRFTGGGNGPYYGLKMRQGADVSVLYLLAVLSHPVVEAMVRSRASEFRGSYYSHGKQFVQNLPVFALDLSDGSEKTAYDRIIKTVERLIEMTEGHAKPGTSPTQRKTLEAQYKRLKQSIVEQVSSLYSLAAEDVAAVTSGNLMSDANDN